LLDKTFGNAQLIVDLLLKITYERIAAASGWKPITAPWWPLRTPSPPASPVGQQGAGAADNGAEQDLKSGRHGWGSLQRLSSS
jgi:hypothetical protein